MGSPPCFLRFTAISHNRKMQNYPCEYNGHHTQQFDQDVDGRPGSILEGIPHGVADHGRLVGLATLAAVFAALDVFLGVVPGAAGVGHHDRKDEAACRSRR